MTSKSITGGTPAPRAAMYVRMSTDPQNYSIQHQCEKLNEYAVAHGMEIVAMYADAGKSGLRINGRDGMKNLIDDVVGGVADFTAILVYDVSRWGRFQDADEAAHYEYLCRQAGIQVIYCAEQFENDGSAIASILKGLKRTMAAEYSRELSAKVLAAQCRFAVQGFKMGGMVGYGLRRVSCDAEGNKRRVLKAGERKAAATDRVRFSWGPQREIDMVRQIYAWYVDDEVSDTQIAAKLNMQKVPTGCDRPWTPWMVKSILTNDKYTGQITFNRGSAKMSRPRTPNPKQDWICKTEAFPPIVSYSRFTQAIETRARRSRAKTSEELLDMLRALHKQHGKVTVSIIEAAAGVPGVQYFANRFGTLARAYFAAGLPSAEPMLRARTLRAVRQMREATMSAMKLAVEQAGGRHAPCEHPWLVLLNDSVSLKLVVARARHDPAGHIRWRIPIHTAPVPDFVLVVQMDTANAGVMGYYLIPVADFTQAHIILRAECPDDRSQYKRATLAQVFGL